MSDENHIRESAAKPQVIDLVAEDITIEPDAVKAEAGTAETETPESVTAGDPPLPPPPYTPPPARQKRRGTAGWVIAALALGLLAGGWIYRGLLSSYLPDDAITAMQSRLAVLEANGKTMGDQFLGLSDSSEKATRGFATLDEAMKSTASGLAGVTARVEDFESRVAATERALASASSDLDGLRAAISAGATGSGANTGTADTAALAALGQRIEALEKDVASLKSGSGTSDNASFTTALSQALADLKAKAAAGASYQEEYDRLTRMVPAASGLDALASHAALGIPSPAGLALELRAAIPALPQPATPPAPVEDSYWNALLGGLSGIVTIRDIGEADWPQLAEKAASLAEAGDITGAIAVIEGAEGSKPSALTQWRDRAAARLKIEAAVMQVSEAVLRQIAALGGGQ